ncbi:hypothetical protein [Thermomonospora umbrina]|uniref:Uncharacterized protein n=1 Tax=Thermomonospora umbrina TaxID=111806 RepID=A0A3D9T1X6_9ACTN|nr:hypothetical protein [Thermomonospora umbrina]REF00344.1 hypothetical protein DFJ69_5876 [Thermomonospora umbrina]
MWLFNRREQRGGSVAEVVAQQTAEAGELARIPGQGLLSDPRTNPAVRGHADQLRDDEHRRMLDALHEQTVRRHRVTGQRAGRAEAALDAVQDARDTTSPARSVLALHEGRRRFMAAALVASLSLSVGAASGVAKFATENKAPWQAGWIAEVGMTGLTTTVILYRSHLTRFGGSISGRQKIVLWVLMIAPLMASMAANLKGAGAVGVACSIGAAAFSLLAHEIASASADAIHDQAEKVKEEDEAKLRSIALGGNDADTAPTTAPTVQAPAGPELSDDELVTLGWETARTQKFLADRGLDLPAEDVVRALASAPRRPVSHTMDVARPARPQVTVRSETSLAPPVYRTEGPPVVTPSWGGLPTGSRTANPETVSRAVPNLPVICGRAVNLPAVPMASSPDNPNRASVREPEPANPVTRTGEPPNLKVQEPDANPPGTVNREPRTTRTGTANLNDRAAKKAAEVEQVLDLIEERGLKAVTLGVVREELGFAKTTAFHRLTAARKEFANRAAKAS